MTAAVLNRSGPSWQVILADLALILFLLTLAALPATEADIGQKLAHREARAKEARALINPEIAAAQALFRPVAGGPTMAEWLAAQPHDPRATLTVFVRHLPGKDVAAWSTAKALAGDALASGVTVRTIITAGDEADVYASLAYDAVVPKVAVAGL